MAVLYILVTLCLSLANGLSGFERSSSDFGVPFPIKLRTEDYYPDLNFDKCGGLVTSPTVINSRRYPFGDYAETCVWKIKTRKCFQPKIILLSSSGYDDGWTPLQYVFNGTRTNFLSKPPGTVFYAPVSEGEVYWRNGIGWNNGYGFQAAIDFIALTTPECMSTFTDIASMTCAPSEKVGNDYVVETPGYPLEVPPATGCRQVLPITTDLLSYEVTITSNMTTPSRLSFQDSFSTVNVPTGQYSQVFVTSGPMTVQYRSSETEKSQGFRMEVKDVRSPRPCGTVIRVGATEVTVTNPFPTTCAASCAIRFQAGTGEKLKFVFDEFKLPQQSTTEFAKLYTDFPTMQSFHSLHQGRAELLVGNDGVFLYKGASRSTLWKLKVSAVPA